MNYQRAYDALIAHRRAVPPAGYAESHHVVPKGLGGSNAKSNLVKLTAREHFVAHALLARIHGGTMWLAVIRMKGRRFGDGYINSRTYERAKQEWAAWSSANQRGQAHWAHGRPSPTKGMKLPHISGPASALYGKAPPRHVAEAAIAANRGAKRTEQTKTLISEAQRGEKNHRFGTALTDGQKEHLSRVQKGRTLDRDRVERSVAARRGFKHSEATKAAMSAARKGRKVHPNTSAAVAAANRRRAAK